MNYFSPQNAAERYSKGRPFFHSNTIEVIKSFLKITAKLNKGLDVACGTGLSTKALLEIAEEVYGTDSSAEMLKRAALPETINYQIALAEKQPFSNNEFDLITVCSGVHWFNIDSFLLEAYRLLKSKQWLILYDNFFISEMINVPAFSAWFPEVYLKKFPSPARNNQYNWSNEHLQQFGFNLVEDATFKNQIVYTKEALILYFTTQSNITTIVENGSMNYIEIETWLDKELSPFFANGNYERTINYGNWIKYLQRLD